MRRSFPCRVRGCAAIAIAFAAIGCSSGTSSSSSPTAATPATSTDAFSGSIPQLGTTGFPFTVANSGTVVIALTSVGPLATMSLGVGIASYDGTTCGSNIAMNDDARSGNTALTGVATPGSYCVNIYDSGNIPAGSSATFSVQVLHP